MALRELVGMLLLTLAAVFSTLLVILSSVTSRLQVPFYSLTGIANIFVALGLLAFMLAIRRQDIQNVTCDSARWILLRGFLSAAAAVLSLAAVAAGAPTGDFSALSNINVIVACLMARAVLKEKLSIHQILAMLLTVAGAVLITKPEAIFGSKSSAPTPWLGYSLALASGVSSGLLFVVSRKIQTVSVLLVATSSSGQEGTAFLVLALLGFFREPSFAETLEHMPLRALLVLIVLLLLLLGFSCSVSAGSSMCPAAASSIIFTFTSMLLGYVAQAVLHDQVPDAITLTGAGLMVLAVVLMSVPKVISKESGNSDPQSTDRPTGDVEAPPS